MGDFYDWLSEEKKSKKLGFKELGDTINVSADAFRMALKRKSFSELEQSEIKRKLTNERIDTENSGQDLMLEALFEKYLKSDKAQAVINNIVDQRMQAINDKLQLLVLRTQMKKEVESIVDNKLKEVKKD